MRDNEHIIAEFKRRRSRQVTAIFTALYAMVVCALMYKRPDMFFGGLPGKTVAGIQLIIIATFAAFSGFNWRCPSCGKYLGSNINKTVCPGCRERLR